VPFFLFSQSFSSSTEQFIHKYEKPLQSALFFYSYFEACPGEFLFKWFSVLLSGRSTDLALWFQLIRGKRLWPVSYYLWSHLYFCSSTQVLFNIYSPSSRYDFLSSEEHARSLAKCYCFSFPSSRNELGRTMSSCKYGTKKAC